MSKASPSISKAYAPMVYLVCDMLGQEDVLIEVSKAFGSRIYIDRDKNSDCHLLD